MWKADAEDELKTDVKLTLTQRRGGFAEDAKYLSGIRRPWRRVLIER